MPDQFGLGTIGAAFFKKLAEISPEMKNRD